MAFTDTWNAAFEALPPDTGENIAKGAERIRDLKVALQERLDVDHYWDNTANGTDADHGEHRKITLHAAIATPTSVANKAFVYAKTANGKLELHYLNGNNQETQITANGEMNAANANYANTANAANTANTATNAANSALLEGNNAAYYRNANNLNAGTAPDGRIQANIARISGNAAANSYMTMSTGMTFQWGQFVANQTDYTFAVAFGTACVAIAFSQAGATSASINRLALASAPAKTGFSVTTCISNMLPAFYIAIGY